MYINIDVYVGSRTLSMRVKKCMNTFWTILKRECWH